MPRRPSCVRTRCGDGSCRPSDDSLPGVDAGGQRRDRTVDRRPPAESSVGGGTATMATACTVEREPAFQRSPRIANARRNRPARDSVVVRPCVSAGLFTRKDTTWTTRSYFLIPTHKNTPLRAKPPENQLNTRGFRIARALSQAVPRRNGREPLCRTVDAAPVWCGPVGRADASLNVRVLQAYLRTKSSSPNVLVCCRPLSSLPKNVHCRGVVCGPLISFTVIRKPVERNVPMMSPTRICDGWIWGASHQSCIAISAVLTLCCGQPTRNR